MKETYGVPVEEIQEAIKHGVRKINIDTDIRLAMTGAMRKFLAENPEKFDPRDYLKPAREAAKADLQAALHRSSAAKARRARSRAQPLTQVAAALREGRAGPDGRLMAAGGAPGDDPPLLESTIRSLPLLARGKVRDNYAVGDDRLLMVASDRLSRLRRDHGRADSRQGRAAHADGAVLVRPARPRRAQPPDRRRARERGRAPAKRAQVRGRSMLVKRLKPMPVEAVVRGYLAGSGWKEYQESRPVCGVAAAAGPEERREAARADLHARRQGRGRRARREHHLRARGARSSAPSCAAQIRDISIAHLRARRPTIALTKGIIIADTKFEFGLDDARHAGPDGRGADARLVALLAGRGLRATGANPPSYDKQFVRDWLEEVRIDGKPWDKTPPAPPLPAEVVAKTAAKYAPGRRAADALSGLGRRVRRARRSPARRSEQGHAQLAPVGVDHRVGRRGGHLAGDLERALLRRRGGGRGAGAACP